ncbi:MAG: cytochrome c oxidase subunit 3 [Francisellaceae bacterium]|jgi:cytochrome c oxidase subunit III|nr:cytochrome c oxidase subunit 3 [Francisellaceae bacterium]MBT6206963.1 cytochrome c oxidase subunit 3 [Francisellaceae bacterium]MBT6538223.1 cytochrome c oxidase subunit 3 [Francisellaceae bacterium]
MGSKHEHYYVPAQSHWPIVGAIGLGFIGVGAAGLFQDRTYAPYVFTLGVMTIIFMMYGWFKNVIDESAQGLYSKQMDRSFRWGMFWFIFSEMMFFVAFFGVLLYARTLSIPWLGGAGNNASTNMHLWSNFEAAWPLLVNPDQNLFPGPLAKMDAWGLPAINTLILLSSGGTITWAHHSLLKGKRKQLVSAMACTVLLGTMFLICQAYEYHEAYTHLKLTLSSGMYGTLFFMLTGFHGMHVTIGTIMLFVILLRCIKGHFTPEHHFAFEAIAWYWHFVDVVWLFLFIVVYWL